uniref:Uncharacterized protein n=1 Tax=viral metagenome TaxID=1070528 RepID=A0A6C0BP12_9ZZZZ
MIDPRIPGILTITLTMQSIDVIVNILRQDRDYYCHYI